VTEQHLIYLPQMCVLQLCMYYAATLTTAKFDIILKSLRFN